MAKNNVSDLLFTESEHLQKLNKIVLNALEEEKLISQKLYSFEDKNVSFSHRVADKVASFGGSWNFIFSFFLFMILWIVFNIVPKGAHFDPYPFILLNLLLSTLAAIQAPIILMSQNRKEDKDRERAVNDYLVNLKAEIEIRNVHQKLDLLIAEQMKTLFELQNVQVEMMDEIKNTIKNSSPKER